MPVEGLGGLFFRARNPDALQRWYAEHLGMGGGYGPAGARHGNAHIWQTLGGPMVFQPFRQDSDYFAADRQFMINLRVSALDDLIGSLRSAGIEVLTDPAWDAPGVGRFARIYDPEGNAIELWEPDETAPA